MKLFGQCNACKKYKFFVGKRSFTSKILGKATSENDLCNKCFKAIKKINLTNI